MHGKREQDSKILAFGVTIMYKKTERQVPLENFYQPFGGTLNPENRWVKLSKVIPWEVIEDKYAKLFAESGMGAKAKSVRMALGALIIKEKCGFPDEELVEQIRENHYFQYFIGLPEYQDRIPFDPSMMVHFRKRLNGQIMKEINELICLEQQRTNDKDDGDPSGEGGGTGKPKNKGHLILDATCTPADIRYPTDLSLLNEAREKLEEMIDDLYEPLKSRINKPRTYRKNARRDYLAEAKAKKHRKRALRKAIGKQLRYVARYLRTIQKLMEQEGHGQFSWKQYQDYETIQKLYFQQKTMFETRSHTIEDRIVSISQPHVRPIVRGKASAETEFGAKIMISVVNGFAFIEDLEWNNFNEGTRLQTACEAFFMRHGYYPEAISADKIFRNRANLDYCKLRGIRLSGPRLGRPNLKRLKSQKRLERLDNKIRNAVEGKFGEGKRGYGLGRIMAKLQQTSESVISLQFLVMNLERKLRLLFARITWLGFRLKISWFNFEV
jgi:IS5 family transposase